MKDATAPVHESVDTIERSPPWGPIGLMLVAAALLLAAAAVPACGGGDETLTVYSGRSQSLVEPLLESFSEETGIDIQVNYASSAAIAATILEEGDNTPADVVFLQDTGSLGALSAAGVLRRLPDELVQKVDARFRARSGEWVGTSRSGADRRVQHLHDRPDQGPAGLRSGLHRPLLEGPRRDGRRPTGRSRPSSRRCGPSWERRRRADGLKA